MTLARLWIASAALFIDGVECRSRTVFDGGLALESPPFPDGAWHVVSIRYTGSAAASVETLRRRAGYGGRKGRRALRRLDRCGR